VAESRYSLYEFSHVDADRNQLTDDLKGGPTNVEEEVVDEDDLLAVSTTNEGMTGL
jgi:hypothetical protein